MPWFEKKGNPVKHEIIAKRMFIVEYKTTKEEEFDVLYQSYVGDIYKVCLYLTKNKEQAEEIAQRTFVKFYDCFENVSPDFILAYLVNIAKDFIYRYQK